MTPQEQDLLKASEELAKVTKQWVNHHKGVGIASMKKALAEYHQALQVAAPFLNLSRHEESLRWVGQEIK